MIVLVAGATGFVASHLVPHLVRAGHTVYAAGHDPQRLAALQGATPIVWDLASHERPVGLPERFDAAVHLAQANVPVPDRVVTMFDVNAGSAVRLLDYARRAGASRFVFASTGSVYGGGDRPWREDDPVRGTDFYAASKIAGERAVQAFAPYMGTTILRLFAPYGPGQTGRLIPGLIGRVGDGRAVTLKEGRGPRFNPLYVSDLVRVVDQALTSEGHHLLNAGGDAALSVREMAQAIGRVLDREPDLEDQPGEVGGDFVGDTARLRQVFPLPERLTTFDEGIRAMVARG